MKPVHISASPVKILWVICIMTHSLLSGAQTIYQYKSDYATICFFDKNQSQYITQLMQKYQLSLSLHGQIWGELPEQKPFMMLSDWEDDGNGGVVAMPHNSINIGLAPMNMTYFTAPSNERYDHLYKHEYTHVVMIDKPATREKKWRNFTGNKLLPDSDYPISALWSYFDTPRCYAPRWYHEGIACFLETWMTGGYGRALGGYDETYFRTRVNDGRELFSVVGLETEGSTSDFQLGVTGYLYGTRFVNYLVFKYGFAKLVQFYNRTDDSKAFYPRQFENVYGKGLREVWDEWQSYERVHQEENLKKINEYPLTATSKIIDRNIGSASPMIVDKEAGVAYMAMSCPGEITQVVSLDLNDTGKSKRIRHIGEIKGYMLYQPAYLAYDKKNQRLIWTDRNGNMRGLQVYDIRKGRNVKHLKYQRTYDIVYDNANDCMYGLFSNAGIIHLVRYDSSFDTREILFSFPYGVSVSDLDVSHDGTRLVASMLGKQGQHSLIMFNVSDLDDAAGMYQTLYTLDDSNLSQFRFSEDDSKLVGFSYYTGVPNIWTYDLNTGSFDLLSNVENGLYAPYLTNDGTIYAYEFSTDGMTPVRFEYNILNDANSVDFMGQKAFLENPEIADLGTVKMELPEIRFSDIYDSIQIYKPLKELKFQGAYPDISGFTDRNAWNNVTPVLGYHLSFYDPLSLCSINLFLGTSAWSSNDWKNRFHAMAEIDYWNWNFKASWNQTSFYDLFGPRRSSRKGYNLSLGYNSRYSMQSPFEWGWGGTISHYGDLDALPMFQEIAVDNDVTSFQTLELHIDGKNTRKTLGGIEPEKGYRFDASGNLYLVNGKLFPSINATLEKGFHLPVGLHNTLWLKGTYGQNFGDSGSSFGNDYFGGFRNNYVDNGEVNRFKTTLSMPGAPIDEICAHAYAKFNAELSFSPIRLNNFGVLQCYPNYIQIKAFANDLMADYWGSESSSRTNYISAGAQMNIPLVLFTYMQTTLSVGYAQIWGGGLNRGELMISLKLL